MEYKEHAFTVHGREIRFSYAQDIYNAIEQQFWPRYNETVKDFDRFYSSNISSFEDIFRYLPEGAFCFWYLGYRLGNFPEGKEKLYSEYLRLCDDLRR